MLPEAPTKEDWKLGFEREAGRVPAHLEAEVFEQRFTTFSQPVKVLCNDGFSYVIKARNTVRPETPRVMITDQIAGRIGESLRAPVGRPALVNVAADLITESAPDQMGHLLPGVAHASLWVEGVDEVRSITHLDVPGNRSRFVLLFVLYSLFGASDHQYNYAQHPPRLVYSMDHGHFFPAPGGVPNWTADGLASAEPATLDPVLSGCNFTADEKTNARTALQSLRSEDVLRAISFPRDEWGINMEERVAITEYLWHRRTALLQLLAA
jgi:hypothetical protein